MPNDEISSKTLTRPPADDAMPLVLLDWRPVRRGTLFGYAKVLLGRSLMISDVTVCSQNGKAWAALPTKAMVADDRHLLDNDGKPRYSPVLEWASASARNRFSASVVRAVLDAFPAALNDDRSWP